MATKRSIDIQTDKIIPSKDPSGFLFYRDGMLLRQINLGFKKHYDYFIGSGLYEKLVSEKLIISHQELNKHYTYDNHAYKIIYPSFIPFISYPYEWSFSQLKDAALTTLRIQKIALEFGMILKDASPFNIQFVEGMPQHIDSLSFEVYKEGKPWIAYRQFCQQFLAPLALASYQDSRLIQLLRVYHEGFPLDLTVQLLPWKSYLTSGVVMHLLLHAKSEYSENRLKLGRNNFMKRTALLGLIDSLETTVSHLRSKTQKSKWESYYDDNSYTVSAFNDKKAIVGRFVQNLTGRALDIGANTGEFSRITSQKKLFIISLDNDPQVVEVNYLRTKDEDDTRILPLVGDITSPVSGVGWDSSEYLPLNERIPSDTVLVLALIHHLVIGRNISFSRLIAYLHKICKKKLIIEFVPKSDPQIKKMLRFREDIFPNYNEQVFCQEMSKYFTLIDRRKIASSNRVIFLYKKI